LFRRWVYQCEIEFFRIEGQKDRRQGIAVAARREQGETGQENPFAVVFQNGSDRTNRFAKRLAILIKSGVSIVTALDILKRQSVSKGSQRIIGFLHDGVERGQSLAKSMESYSNVFGHFGVSIVMVGETSGTLVQNLHYLADETKKKQELKHAIIGALIYPAFILVATVGIVIMLMIYVFPKILPIFPVSKPSFPGAPNCSLPLVPRLRLIGFGFWR